MAEKPGLLKRLFRFGKKPKVEEEKLEVVEDATSDTALAPAPDAPVTAHAEAASSVITDEEAGADVDADGGIEPIKDTPPPEEPQDGVFDAPGETHFREREDTPEPLSQTPEPMPSPVAEEIKPAEGDPKTEPGPDEPEVEESPESDAAHAGEVEEAAPAREETPSAKGTREPAQATSEDAVESPDTTAKSSWFARLRHGLSRSSQQLTEGISGVFTRKRLDEESLQDLEDVLIQADLGVTTAMQITERLADQKLGKDVEPEEVRTLMAEEIEKVLDPVASELELDLDHSPHVILVVGVNGSGKTTTIGKLSQKLYDAGFSTLLVAGDTFRAAAIEQLNIWGSRTLSPVVSRPLGSDAAGLAFDAYQQCVDEGRDVMLMDTAGRLQNKKELMAELEKVIRVLKKHDPSAPHTVLLTLDATTGQNAINQVDIFRDVAGVNGLVMTKLDGTARGGILVAISAKHQLPVYFIGVGEGVDDLEPFEARDFARSIAGLAQ